jgi:predicted DNA-binding helix-hairpin-helix protein
MIDKLSKQTLQQKLQTPADAAKYDVSCASSGTAMKARLLEISV